MKRTFLFVFFIFLMRFTLHAQESSNFSDHFYARAGGGFGIGLCNYDPCDYYDEDYYPTSNNFKSINFVPGRGFNVDVAGGYMFTKNIGAELALKDFFGLPIKETYNNYNTESYFGERDKYQYNGMLLQVIPSVVLDLGLDKVDPYARFGLVIGAYPLIKYKETDVRNGDTYEYVGKYIGNIPLGFSAAAGVKYNLNDHLSLYGEFDCNGINYSPKKYKLTKYTVNGVDMLSTLPLRQTETDFVKSYDGSQTSNTSPKQQLKQTFPFSNFEINIGAAYRF